MLQVRVLHRPLRELRLLLSAMLSFCLISAITGLFIRIAVHGSAVFLPNKLGIWTAKCQSKCRGVSVMIQNKSWNIMCASANVSKLREWVCAKLFWDSVFNAWDLVISVSNHFLIKPYYTCDMLFASKFLRMHSIRFVHSLVGEMPVLLVQTGSDVYWGLLLPFSKPCHLSIVAVLVMRILFLFTRLMFPLALTAQYFGMSNSRMSLNVLARSFPWIGIHVDVLRTGGRRMWPLFRSHMLFLLIQSFVPGRFQSCNHVIVILKF